jgi:4-diphosphocytidyl-2-C-methyl-D-erythritol kinase
MATLSFMTVTDISRDQTGGLRIKAPAKVNLFLEITGRRADGYHTIDSLMGFLDLADVVHLRPADALSLTMDGPFADQAPLDESNLAVRAVRLLEERVGRSLPVALHIEKMIPAGAGLGGGSSDAAAVLRGMRALFDLTIGDDQLAGLGLALGADVPACLASVPVLAGGIGEQLQPAPAVPELHLALVHPGVGLATPDVYGAYDRGHMDCACCHGHDRLFMPISWIDAVAQRRNDLEAAAMELEPLIASMLDQLSGTPGCQLARMSGSGTACFGIYGDRAMAEKACAELRAAFPGWWVRPARLEGSAS